MTAPAPESPRPRQEDALVGLSEAQRALVIELRAMRERAGLSLVELGRRTNYSKSSWERWLNGKRPVPLPAVIALADACGQDSSRLIGTVLATESSDAPNAADAPGAPDGPDAPDASDAADAPDAPKTKAGADGSAPRARPSRLVVVLAVGVAVGAVAAGVAVAVRPSPALRLGSASPTPRPPGCVADSCRGLDPEDNRCIDDAQTITFDQRPELTVNLRYSAACQAAWGQIVAARPGDVVSVHAPDGTAQSAKIAFGDVGHTTMLPARDPAALWACGQSHDAQVPACTAPVARSTTPKQSSTSTTARSTAAGSTAATTTAPAATAGRPT